MRKWVAVVCVAVLVSGPGVGMAQMVVNDPANLAQNAMSVSQEAQQIVNQIEQIQTQFQQLQQLEQDLEQLSPDQIQTVREAWRRLEDLYDQAEQISMRWENIVEEYQELYDDPDVTDAKEVRNRREDWGEQTDRAMESAFQQQGVVDDFDGRNRDIESMAEASQDAEGTLAAIQAGNEMTRVILEQQMEMMELLSADSRAMTSKAREEQARRETKERRIQWQYSEGWDEQGQADRDVSNELPDFK